MVEPSGSDRQPLSSSTAAAALLQSPAKMEEQELQGLQVTARDTAAVEREVMLATAPELLAATQAASANTNGVQVEELRRRIGAAQREHAVMQGELELYLEEDKQEQRRSVKSATTQARVQALEEEIALLRYRF